MGSKANPGKFDCYANALPNEPMFVLLARDSDAPARVEEWAFAREEGVMNGSYPASDIALVQEARECAYNMREWRRLNLGAWRKKPT